MAKKSPLAPKRFPALPDVPGVRLAAGACGLRYRGRTDLMMAAFDPGTAVAGVFTRSLTASAPVDWCRKALRQARGRAAVLVVNSGNANAFTGRAGDDAVAATVAAAAKQAGCKPGQVFVSSTGVIGEPLPAGRIVKALPKLAKQLSPASWHQAAEAIMTTDTFPKGASRTAEIGGTTVTINGIAKGSGMIAPDMATMLGYVATDAKLPADVLQKLLIQTNARSFNAITVDSDTSTSDTVLLFATGQAKHSKINGVGDPKLRDFKRALGEVMTDLAHQIVRDGEGAQKFVSVTVTGATSAAAARKIAFAVANSPLVKTAVAGEDPNWGRVVMAVGKSGQKVDRDRLSVSIGGLPITENGMVRPGYDEAPVAEHMKGREIDISVDIGLGRGRFTVWTCDLTDGYIRINADYRS